MSDPPRPVADGVRASRRGRPDRPTATGRRGQVAGIDRVTAILAVVTFILLGAGVGDISHSVLQAIMAAAAITAGLVITLTILRPSR
ncbi:hypothetical protein AB0H42_33630 [Nocardia sp. NPDC050799]|uniref:hypothetical protein n=1 Tax=Nocardia sp. NPDC050799 TaxID=3154842 RepID=UPI0033C2F11C